MNRYEAKYAIFYFKKEDESLIDEISTYLDECANRIFDFFKVVSRNKVVINIIPTKEEFDRKFILDHKWANENFNVPKWAIGYYIDSEITYLSLNDYNNTTHNFKKEDYTKALDYYKKTIIHEFVHYVNDLFIKENKCGPIEKYLQEGIAVYLSGQKEDVELSFDFTLEEILQKDMNKSCYNGWYLITKYLVENYQKNFVLDLFKSNRRSKEFLEKELYNKVKDKYGDNCKR